MTSPPLRSDLILEQMQNLHPKSIDLSLDRVFQLLEKLGSPHDKLPPVVHVAGTNGKGSVLAFLNAILNAQDFKVQRFSSPHLVHFHERINLAEKGKTSPIGEKPLVDLLTRTQKANGNAPITFFEITTVAAFLAFSEQKADWCLLETGLGGRLDATNVVQRPAASVITPISIDHQRFLGTEITDIAREKAGILKPGVTGIIGLQPQNVLDVLQERAQEIGAPLIIRGQDYDVYAQRGRLVYSSPDQLIDLPLPRHLIGRHQIENAGLAIATAQHLLGDNLQQIDLSHAMEKTDWPARMQKLKASDYSDALRSGDELWLDGGHNPAAAAALAELVGDLEEKVPRPLHLIIGMMTGKDVRGFLHEFHGLAAQVIAVPIPNEDGAMNADDLADLAVEMGFEADTASSFQEALQISAAGRHEDARIVICGSLYLAGHVLGANNTSLNEAV